MFDSIVNWKLKKGSHDFPGPDGGTCVNEAAIVAAGFEYKEVNSPKDCPPCFSRPIASYAIMINDSMPDNLRQELLMPFVMRLAGTADTEEVELKRIQFMAVEICRSIISEICMGVLERPDLAEECENVKTFKEVENIFTGRLRNYSCSHYTASYVSCCYSTSYTANAAYVAELVYATYNRYSDSIAYASKAKYYTIACQILNEAILLGKHTELEVCEIAPRLEAAKVKEMA